MTRIQRPSLKWRLFMMLSTSTLLVWLAVCWFVHQRLVHEFDEIYDAQLQQSSRILAGIIRAGEVAIGLAELQAAQPNAYFAGIPQVHSKVDQPTHTAGKYERHIGYQIVDPEGTLLFRSPGAPDAAFPIRKKGNGFSDPEVNGFRWRVCSFRDTAMNQVIHIGEHYGVRREISKYLLRSMCVPVLLGIATIGILICLSLNWGLKPLSKLARQVGDRRPGDFSAVDMSVASTENSPIADSLNALLTRVRDAFDSERRFTGDAAHELLTPLAALNVQSQVALRSENEIERKNALKGVLAGVDRATRLVEQLLNLSRLDWDPNLSSNGIVSVNEIIGRVAYELAESAQERTIIITGSGEPNTPIRADEALVSMLARNLLDNAIRYSYAGGEVRWLVTREKRHVMLEVMDTGPGIPAHERELVFDRFRRLPGSRGRGSGLGLSIVRKIAVLYGASISLTDPEIGRGLRVQVRFDLATAESDTHRDDDRPQYMRFATQH